MKPEQFLDIAPTIPQEPGIYKYLDRKKELLYVGKAKNLRKRVSSYFNKTLASFKTMELVHRIEYIEFTLVNSEQDAFLLENALIKQYQPRFNINLKDDKSYPYIVIKKEPFPRVFLTRRKLDDGSEYLGPYTSVAKVRELLNFIRANVQLRTCKLNLTAANIQKKKFKVCLEYHLGNCKGPCEGLQSEEDYHEGLMRLRNLLRGNVGPVLLGFRKEMKIAAEQMAFEQAEVLRRRIDHLENYQSSSVVVSRHILSADIFSMLREGEEVYVNYLMVQNGTIVQTHTSLLETHLEETDSEVLAFSIARIRDNFGSRAPEIIVPIPIEYLEPGVTVTLPRGGDRKKLLELSEKNVRYYREEQRKRKTLHLDKKTDEQREESLYRLMEDLKLPELPVRIECFDNSNFQGSYAVSAMVCFLNGLPSKNEYRHFNVKTVQGIDDFATMKEVVFRRYRRVISEKALLPQLVIIDGGKGQLNAALESLKELSLGGKLTVIGLAKNEEEIFFPGDSESFKLPYQSESLQLIRRIRDEVHRFGIAFHRKKRSQGTFSNELEKIKGIGKSTADRLLSEFRSVGKVRRLSREALTAAVGPSKAEIIWKYFSQQGTAANKEGG
jgi:excinuclease ABC subunit C